MKLKYGASIIIKHNQCYTFSIVLLYFHEIVSSPSPLHVPFVHFAFDSPVALPVTAATARQTITDNTHGGSLSFEISPGTARCAPLSPWWQSQLEYGWNARLL